MIHYLSLNEEFIIDRFPELKEQVIEDVEYLNDFLPHVIFGNVFNHLTSDLLKRDDYSSNKLLHSILEMYEELSSNGDNETKNLVQVTLLEYLWDEKITYNRALELIGEHTKKYGAIFTIILISHNYCTLLRNIFLNTL